MSTAHQPPTDESVLRLKRKVRNLTLLLMVVSILVVVPAIIFGMLGWRKLNAIAKTEDDIQFAQFITASDVETDYIQPTVNTIQFLHHGYSISLESVQYTQDGLALSGTIGNPTNLWISSLALDMTARPYPYKIKDKWLQGDKLIWWPEDWNIGHAQTTVGFLNPGSTTEFRITIPNVKQTPDGFQIAVSFSGERYQYLGK